MDLAALRVEFLARGFNDLEASGTNTRKDAWINRAYFEVCEEEDWPFLEVTTTGAPPLSVSDLRTIMAVTDTTNQRRLYPLDRRHILESDYQLTTTGTPEVYYLTAGTSVAVYPANTGVTLAVRYWKVPAILSTGTDLPLLPTRFHNLLIDGAVVYAYRDKNNYEAADATQRIWEQGKARMRDSLIVQQHDYPDDYVVTTGSTDW